MPTIDKRNTVEYLYTNGTDVGCAVHLSDEEAELIYGEGSTAGWYVPWTFEGGRVLHETEFELDEDEATQLTGKIIEQADRFTIENVIKETHDAAQDLIDKVLSKGPHKYRLPLPAGHTTVDIGEPAVPTKVAAHQLYCLYNGIVPSGYEIPTGKGKRTRPIRIVGSKKDGKPSHVRKTVYMADQSTWPDEVADFKDAP